MATGILRVKGTKVVDSNDQTVVLRGAGLGGWMNMENFVTGFPGSESGHRAAMLTVLGEEKSSYFFDKWLEYFFTEADAHYFATLGLNCIRIPFNYRHFEDDMNPRILKEGGFKHLDRVVNLCAKEGIYTILDMHALPGGHNQAWHSDNPTSYPAFWDYKDHQDRTVWLWEQIARHYKGNPWIAGYNPMNEPADIQHVRLPAFYKRLEAAMHAIDPDHILWLDGNTYSSEFIGFSEVLPNCVYALHDYSLMGFPDQPQYTGSEEQKAKLRSSYKRKSEWHSKVNAPVWNGEFGPVYANPAEVADAEKINEGRYALLGEQLKIYDEEEIPWTIWLYKDIGLQGMVCTSPDSSWNKLIAPFLERKKMLQVDQWGRVPSEEVEQIIEPVVGWLEKVSPSLKMKYPKMWGTQRHVRRALLHTLLAESLQIEFAELFAGKTMEQLEDLARSFAFENCIQRSGLNSIMAEHAKVRKS